MELSRLLTGAWALLLASVGASSAACPDASVTFEVRGMLKTASGAT